MESEITVSSILFIVLLIVPGVFFKRFYFQGQFSQQFGAGLFADRLITSIFWGICVQIISLMSFSRMMGFTFEELKHTVSEVYKEISKNIIPEQMTYESIRYLLGYLMFTSFIAFILGALLHKLIRLFKIDLKFELLRFSNEWNYYFKGEILETKDFAGGQRGKVLSTQVDLVIDEGAPENKLVTGFLTQYTLSSETGKLETIYLTSAQRWSKGSQPPGFKDIPGDCLIIPYEKVMNMNVRYNIQSFTPVNWRRYTDWAVNTILVMGIGFLLVYPWFLPIGFFRKIFAALFSTVPWMLFMSFVTIPFQTGPNAQRYTWKNTAQTLFAIILTSIMALYFIGESSPIVKWLFSWFH